MQSLYHITENFKVTNAVIISHNCLFVKAEFDNFLNLYLRRTLKLRDCIETGCCPPFYNPIGPKWIRTHV
jgi:hypothetical protein